MTGWVSFFAGFSAPIAAAALAFSDYLGYFFPALKQANAAGVGSGAFSLRLGAGQLVASALIAAFTVLNCLGVGRTAKVQNVLTSTKRLYRGLPCSPDSRLAAGNWSHFREHAVRTSTLTLPAQIHRQPVGSWWGTAVGTRHLRGGRGAAAGTYAARRHRAAA